ncbi:STAS-like domain-containing protein [Bacterioplanoides pacificum]|uniref:STAS-like domain-containing protein n=1 Tax=Bacterioplanoides pacificum TaxID=1171596 RepID=A0ABV7VPE1_9GAMM
MKCKTYKFAKSCLSSRPYGASIRREWVSMLEAGNCILVDCSEVDSISDSFADELFGILSVELTPETLCEAVKLSNISDSCLQTIAEAIQERAGNLIAA